jgi:hypothetical protein
MAGAVTDTPMALVNVCVGGVCEWWWSYNLAHLHGA